jgi:plastocyanin domain-containing protein
MKYALLILVSLSISGNIFAFDYADEENERISWKQPTREVAVIVTDEGYYPEQLVVFQGEKITFHVTSTTKEVSCFMIEGHKVFLSAKKGEVSQVELTVKHDGSFPVYCPSGKHKGELLVLKKKDKKKIKRTVASSKPKFWVPKEY